MKPYDKSNSFMRRVTKRVSELIPGATWMNMLLGESQSGDDLPLASENDDQPPVKKLCTSNNTFTNVNKRTCTDTNPTIDNHRNPRNVLSPEISAVTCLPSTSRQSPKFISQSNSSLLGHDVGNRSSLKRKSDAVDLSNINRPSQKTLAFNFASSTPTLNTVNQQPMVSLDLKPLQPDKQIISNEFSTPTSSKLLKSRGNNSQSSSKCRETKLHTPSPSFRWDTFLNYGELSERQKLFAQKSPLNCSQVMYGGSSARSNLSKILGNTPAIHRKATIPISPTKNSEIRTTSSILLSQISTKDKKIEENTFIIQPKVNLKHKADQKPVSVTVEPTVKLVDTPEKIEDKSNNVLIASGRDSSRKLRANISKKVRGLQSELEMPVKVDLPHISFSMPILPSINLSNSGSEDNEFTFNQPLTIEQFSKQIVEKSSRKKQKMNLKKTQNSNIKDQHLGSIVLNSSCNLISNEPPRKKTENVSNQNNVKNSQNYERSPESTKCRDVLKDTNEKSIVSPSSVLKSQTSLNTVFDKSSLVKNSSNPEQSEKLTTEPKKWTCDACWISNNSDKLQCAACQTPKPGNSLKPSTVTKSSSWTCETCWIVNKNEVNSCAACQTQKPGTAKKVVEPNSNWTCDGCWIKNKSDCTSCISCGTTKPGSIPDSKPQASSTQFKFGLNNNTFDNSGNTQFKFGFDSNKTDQSSTQFKFGSASTFKTSENGKSDSSVKEFKFGFGENKIDQPIGSFKFGSDSFTNKPEKKSINALSNNNADQPSSQFKFGIEQKLDQPESQFKFGLNSDTNKSIPQFKFGAANVENENSDLQTFSVNNSKDTLPTNEFTNIVNDKKEISEKLSDNVKKSSTLKFGDTKQTEKSTSQLGFGIIKNDCNDSSSFSSVGNQNNNHPKTKFVWDKKDKIEIKPITFGITQTNQSNSGNSSTTQLVNGHSNSKESTNEEQKSGLIKTSQYVFGSVAKQDHNLPDDQKKPTGFTFGSVTNDDKSLASPIGTSSFSNTGSVFGASNAVFGSGSISSTPGILNSSSLKPFSFGSMAPPASDGLFSKTIKDNDKNVLTNSSNAFNSTSSVGFSFGAQSPPMFSAANAGGFAKPTFQADDPSKSISNNLFSQSNTKTTVKLDPNAPISINFTGGATTQFTANPETSEPAPKRKILKPVRRIR